MVQLNQGDVRRYVGVASTVIGLVCYALSSSFNRLYGEWNSFKICAYIVSSSIICLAILFPKAWQHLRIFHYKDHMTFLVMTSTTVYSFYLDRKMNTKLDAYGPISSAAFATTSLCMSKQVECGFLDLLNFFCGVLITQLMLITPLFGFVGIVFSYFVLILRPYLDASQPPQEGGIPNPAITEVNSSGASPESSSDTSTRRASSLPSTSTGSASPRALAVTLYQEEPERLTYFWVSYAYYLLYDLRITQWIVWITFFLYGLINSLHVRIRRRRRRRRGPPAEGEPSGCSDEEEEELSSEEEEEGGGGGAGEGSNQNQAATAQDYSLAARRSPSLRYRFSTSRASPEPGK